MDTFQIVKLKIYKRINKKLSTNVSTDTIDEINRRDYSIRTIEEEIEPTTSVFQKIFKRK